MTDDTLSNFTYHPDTDTINLEEYLNITQLPPPEFTFTINDNSPDLELQPTIPVLPPQARLDHEEDPTAVFRPITNKLLKTMALHQHTQKISRKRVVDRILSFYDKGVKQFWEVYAGQSNLSKAMSDLGSMRSPRLISTLAGTSRRHIIGVSSSDYFVEFALTLYGLLPLALCGALFRI